MSDETRPIEEPVTQPKAESAVDSVDVSSDGAASAEPPAAGPAATEAIEGAAAALAEATETEPAPAEADAAVESQVVEVATAEQVAAAGEDPLDGDDDDAEEEGTLAVAPMGPIEELSDEEAAEDIKLDWYILKVQSNRERTSSEALKRKVAVEGIDHLFGEIIVPTEKVTEFKNGKKKTVSRKIWPGYIAVQMHVNDDTWFAIRETSGIGDFTGASGKPIPMDPADVEKILPKEEGVTEEEDAPKLNIRFAEGDKVKVTDGNFENFEGDVDSIDQHSGKVTVMISIFGRSTPVELEYWQVEKL